MISIREMLNRIRFDNNLNKEEYMFFYEDRILKSKKSFKFRDIKDFNAFLTIKAGNKAFELPLHRIRKVTRNNKLIWERKNGLQKH
ncbi:DUF504 domain-containing protein [Candidatus Woesearchaeota archaeon]|nr:DUF504 domain-containing protein [Candidatus Woesearchaeota archaeon]